MCDNGDLNASEGINPVADINVICDCGNELHIDLQDWLLIVHGKLIFKCSCGQEISTIGKNGDE